MEFNEKRDNLNEQKLRRMKLSILAVERENMKTKKHTNEEMVDKVRKIIEEEVKKCF